MARIICLANSYKHGGRCIAGIEPETGAWIRPVPNTPEQAITRSMRLINGNEPRILDIIEIPLENYGPDNGCQPENRLFKPGTWRKVGRITAKELLDYCEDDTVILHNHEEYVSPEFFTTHPKSEWRSTQLVHNTEVRFNRAYDPKNWRAWFRDGRGRTLDLPLTDPVMSDRLRNGEKVGRDCILMVSLAPPWKPEDSNQPELCYKMVAGVVEL